MRGHGIVDPAGFDRFIRRRDSRRAKEADQQRPGAPRIEFSIDEEKSAGAMVRIASVDGVVRCRLYRVWKDMGRRRAVWEAVPTVPGYEPQGTIALAMDHLAKALANGARTAHPTRFTLPE